MPTLAAVYLHIALICKIRECSDARSAILLHAYVTGLPKEATRLRGDRIFAGVFGKEYFPLKRFEEYSPLKRFEDYVNLGHFIHLNIMSCDSRPGRVDSRVPELSRPTLELRRSTLAIIRETLFCVMQILHCIKSYGYFIRLLFTVHQGFAL